MTTFIPLGIILIGIILRSKSKNKDELTIQKWQDCNRDQYTQTMQQYNLGTPRNVTKNKKVLEEKDIVEINGENITFNDPIFSVDIISFSHSSDYSIRI